MASTAKQATRSTVPSPWLHQRRTEKFFERKPCGFDLSDPGTGKTRAAIEIYATRRDRKRMLVVCPKTLMTAAWAADIEKFAPTPNPNSVTEMWHPALIIDDGKRLGMSFFKFRNVMQTPTQVGPSANHLKWDDKPGAQQAMSELLADITIRHAFEDVMTNVPANHRDTKYFELSRKCRAAYDQMAAQAVIKLKDDVVSAVHAASLRTKLLQIASGAAYSDGEDYALIDRGRYELIAELVEERDHSIVFFNWRHQRDELCTEFEKRGITFAVIDGSTPQRERDEIVTTFQAGAYQALLLHPKTGAHGLTLTRGTTTVVSSPIYEADLLKQAIHRIYRGGQTQATNTILVCASGTVEEKVYARLDEKYAHMVDLLDLLEGRGGK
jgi:SNF2 family DNA or RNA helicase